jgi:tight adherence protein C
MSLSLLLQIACAGLLTTITGAFVLHMHIRRQERLAVRLQAVNQRRTQASRPRAATPGLGVTKLIGGLGTRIARSGLLSPRTISELRETLVSAGFRAEAALGLFIGMKIVLIVAVPLVAWAMVLRLQISPIMRDIVIGGGVVLGLLLPDITVRRVRSSYLKRVERGIPDALDMLVICAEAGLALEPAIVRVSSEIRFAHPAIAEELAITANELRILADARLPLTNMGKRTGLDSLRRLGATAVQTIQYGTPLAHALRVLAAELRQEMLTRFEERAARLPVLLTVPMIVFILPALFIVVGGPAAIQVMTVMHH